MKKIEAIIRSDKLYDVLDELERHQIFGITVTNVAGCGRQKGHTRVYRGQKYSTNLVTKTKIEIVVKDSWVDEITEAIIKSSKTGNIGDGKIFIYNIEDAYRIRTGERGEDALV